MEGLALQKHLFYEGLGGPLFNFKHHTQGATPQDS
jgi:hypothetical protein